jgi:RHH-type proline utilization regulon transcriptional repressor/proline dehydrogenase/delta 1-pyrroline-5-carboxylate dehydrogenase
MARFCAPDRQQSGEAWGASVSVLPAPQGTDSAPVSRLLPGPTGESNRLTLRPRAPLLCLGPGAQAQARQARAVQEFGGRAICPEGAVVPDLLREVDGISGVIWWGDAETARAMERALAARRGPILPLIPGLPDKARVLGEHHVCVDTTAAGGNAALLGGAA